MYDEGLFPDRSEAEHRALTLPSPSMLGRLAASPAAYMHALAHPMEPTPAMQFGTLVHALALTGSEPEGWASLPPGVTASAMTGQAGQIAMHMAIWGSTPPDIALRPPGIDLRTAAGKDWRKGLPEGTTVVDSEVQAQVALIVDALDRYGVPSGTIATWINAADWERAEAAAESISRHGTVAHWLEARDVETAMVWRDPETGVLLKGKYDLRAFDPSIGWLVADLKVMAAGPDYDAVQRQVWSYRYDRQLALYASGLEVLTGERHTAVVVPADPQPPHGVNVYPLSPTMQLRGLSDARDLLRVLAACQASGQWPADDRDLQPIGRELVAPRWARYQEEEE